ncbi:NADPH-dependent F420 reductase [Nocardia gipuzkoensis]
MKITVIGAGAIGGNLAAKLSAAGHDVQVADARGPEAVSPEILRTGAHAVDLDNSVKGRDAVILAIPFGVQGQLAELFASVPEDTVVIDTSNYYPGMGGHIESVDNGKAESVYASDLLGRPVTKAWNAALAGTQATKGVPAGTPGRIAIPVAGDNEQARKVAMQLVDDTGFDPYDAGPLADSWRQQPMGPASCTELTLDQLPTALAAADPVKDRAVRDSGGRAHRRPPRRLHRRRRRRNEPRRPPLRHRPQAERHPREAAASVTRQGREERPGQNRAAAPGPGQRGRGCTEAAYHPRIRGGGRTRLRAAECGDLPPDRRPQHPPWTIRKRSLSVVHLVAENPSEGLGKHCPSVAEAVAPVPENELRVITAVFQRRIHVVVGDGDVPENEVEVA